MRNIKPETIILLPPLGTYSYGEASPLVQDPAVSFQKLSAVTLTELIDAHLMPSMPLQRHTCNKSVK
jgi:hypothetical protein